MSSSSVPPRRLGKPRAPGRPRQVSGECTNVRSRKRLPSRIDTPFDGVGPRRQLELSRPFRLRDTPGRGVDGRASGGACSSEVLGPSPGRDLNPSVAVPCARVAACARRVGARPHRGRSAREGGRPIPCAYAFRAADARRARWGRPPTRPRRLPSSAYATRAPGRASYPVGTPSYPPDMGSYPPRPRRIPARTTQTRRGRAATRRGRAASRRG